MIGNAHIDPVWLWQWTEGREEVLSTFRTALQLIEEDGAFVFCASSAAHYAWIEDYDPPLFERVRDQVRAGRIVPVGGWWVQPDCNIPSGEALARQALYGLGWIRDRLGVEVTVGYNVDTFGHPATLPQILAKSGLRYYCFFRPDPREKTLPGPVFRWEAPDGTSVIACRPVGMYATGPEEIEDRIRQCAEAAVPPLNAMLCFYGVGNHGGGPTRRNLASIHRLEADPDLPALVMSGPEPFFRAAEALAHELPVIRDELQYHSRGCYSAVSEVKRENRQVENLLLTAERITSVASALGLCETPREDLSAAWRLALFNQFHDVLAGTSIRPAYDDARADYAEAKLLAGRWLRRALHRIAATVDTSGEGQAAVVFNPTAEPRTEVVELDIAYRGSAGETSILDDGGEEVPATLLEPTVHTGGRTHAVAFTAELPALGYRVYRLAKRVPEVVHPSVEVTATSLESNGFRVELDAETGWLKSVVDKQADVQLLAGPGNVPIVMSDPSDTWSHGVPAFRDEVGAFRLARDPEVFLQGPTHGALRLVYGWEDSIIEQYVVLYQGMPEIHFRTAVDWHEKHRMLKASFPMDLAQSAATFEVAYGHIARAATGDEQPAHRWVDVTGTISGKPYGVALLNDGKYGVDVLGAEVRLSLLRSPIYAFHDPQRTLPGEEYEYTDQGVQTFTYALLPHEGPWQDSQVVRRALALNAPCLCVVEPAHGGPNPPARSFLSHTGDSVSMDVLKQAEDGDGLVLRGYETVGRGEAVEITFLGCALGTVTFGPNEIRSWRLRSRGDAWAIEECDLIERS
jgi:alpha-mannosidase